MHRTGSTTARFNLVHTTARRGRALTSARARNHRLGAGRVTLATLTVVLAACAPGGSGNGAETQPPTAISTDLGTKPVTLTALTDTSVDKDSFEKLGAAFHKKYPNVTVEVKSEQFTVLQQNGLRLISDSNAPDIIRFPTLGNAVKDGLLTNLDPYAEAYGWDQFPATQLEQWRVSSDGTLRGSGPLYGMGTAFSLTGVYYNREKAAAIGMTKPPATLSEFEGLLAKADATGDTALMTSTQEGGMFWPYQALMLTMGGQDTKEALSNWVFNVPGASIQTPTAVEAAQTLVDWEEKGYLPSDVVGLSNTQAVSRFTHNEGVFFYDGNWDAATINTAMGANGGFFLLPPAEDGGEYASMSDPINYVIPAKAQHKDAAAAFLNFAFSDEGRAIIVETTGQVPGGPAEAAVPSTDAGAVIHDTLVAFQQLNADDGITPYIGNATATMYTDTIIPQFQLLAAGRVSPTDFVAKLQSDYESQLGR